MKYADDFGFNFGNWLRDFDYIVDRFLCLDTVFWLSMLRGYMVLDISLPLKLLSINSRYY